MPDRELAVLHVLRLTSFTSLEVVASRTGLAVTEVEVVLKTAAERGHVTFRDGRLSGWALTASGRSRGEVLLAGELDMSGRRAEVVRLYRRFLTLNPTFLALCTDWQLRSTVDGQVPNDHTDPGHDAAVVARLGEIDDAIQPVLAELVGLVPRFRGYGERLAAARARVDAGEGDWFTRPVIDSYHTVWFELHEDLLATLGLERTSERDA